jgi:hypothetical protein
LLEPATGIRSTDLHLTLSEPRRAYRDPEIGGQFRGQLRHKPIVGPGAHPFKRDIVPLKKRSARSHKIPERAPQARTIDPPIEPNDEPIGSSARRNYPAARTTHIAPNVRPEAWRRTPPRRRAIDHHPVKAAILHATTTEGPSVTAIHVLLRV